MEEYLQAMITELCAYTHNIDKICYLTSQIRDIYLDMGRDDVARCLGFMVEKGLRPLQCPRYIPTDSVVYRWYRMTNGKLYNCAYYTDFIYVDILTYLLQRAKLIDSGMLYVVSFDSFEEAVLFLEPILGSDYEKLT